MTKPFQGISVRLSHNTVVKRRYSVTQDVVAFRRCARQYGAFNAHKYAPAQQTQAYFGTVLHQVLDRCHTHFHGIINPSTKGLLPDNGRVLSEEDISDYFGEAKSARKTGQIDPLPPSDIVRYFI